MERIKLTIPTLLGTEPIIANEVNKIGYETTEITDGRVTFEGDLEAICVANIGLRCAERIMIKMGEFEATTFDMLFEGIKRIPWENYMEKDATFPIKGYSLKSILHSVPACQSIVKKAIVSRLSSKYGVEWFDELGPVFPIRFAIMKDIITVYIDTSGESLYKRGYREKSVIAPMRETLAYAMIDMSFWRGDRPFIDPFCGSGTLPIEAALYATNTAPGIKRRFISETWLNKIPRKMWDDAREEAKENAIPSAKTRIYASDIDPEAIAIAKKNAQNAGVADKIHFSVCDVANIKSFNERGVIICNPPYGERLLDAKSCERLYRMMGKKFGDFREAKKYILTSHEHFEKFYGKIADKKRKLYNGMLKCYVYQYFKD